jgi:hypothetical protein
VAGVLSLLLTAGVALLVLLILLLLVWILFVCHRVGLLLLSP